MCRELDTPGDGSVLRLFQVRLVVPSVAAEAGFGVDCCA